MQETTVGFEPMYEGQLPWLTKLFVMYLAVALLASVFRAIRLMWSLRSLRKMEQETANEPPSGFQFLWDSCHAKTASTKNLSALTFLLSFLVSAWSMTRILTGVSMEKVTGMAFLAGATSEVLTIFSLGILVSTALYAFAFFYEALLVRFKLRFVRPGSATQLPVAESRQAQT
jgi:hypothetical protein